MSKVALKANNISIVFGGLRAVEDFSIEIKEGELVGLIGPNGAGKTTVFNMLTGVYIPTSGTIELRGVDVTKMSAHNRVKMGISRTFQNIRLFKRMSVLENVKVSSNINMNYSIFDGIFKTKKYYEQEDKATAEAMEILEVLGLSEYVNEQAQNLPYGKQRKLEIARALASHPSILCLDEPAAGMNPIETEELMETIKIVREKFNTAVLLIEHDMKLVMGICEWIKVISFGKEIATGTPDEIKNNKEVITAYLGE
ncbi:MAG: ABC transporter ATP-binding protein [Bacilli bacterium]|nr:ABC transporter ATP-binding protein [Bacilli bacterium]